MFYIVSKLYQIIQISQNFHLIPRRFQRKIYSSLLYKVYTVLNKFFTLILIYLLLILAQFYSYIITSDNLMIRVVSGPRRKT